MKIISHPDNSTSFEVMESQLENPLIDTNHQDLYALKQLALPGLRHKPYHRKNQTDDQDGKYSLYLSFSPFQSSSDQFIVILQFTKKMDHSYIESDTAS